MSDCCSSTEEANGIEKIEAVNTLLCPSCNQKGKTVDTQTVKSLLAISLEEVDESVIYRFCKTADCPITYFGGESSIFIEAQLRESVHQKHPDDADVLVCYCYQHTPGSIRAEVALNGQTDVVARVTAGTKAGTCACDIRNPQGSCCLGNVSKVVKQIMIETRSVPA